MKQMVRTLACWLILVVTLSSLTKGKNTSQTELVVQNGPYGIVHMSDFSPDGKLLATVSGDARLRIWEVESGRLIRVMGEEASPMTAVAFSPDGLHVATGKSLGDMSECRGACDFRIEIWNIKTGKAELTIKRKKIGQVWDLTYSPDGKWIAVSSGGLEIRKAKNGELLKRIKRKHGFWEIEFNGDGDYLAGGGFKKIEIWRTSRWEKIHNLESHKGDISSIRFHNLKNSLLSVSYDTTIKLWNTSTGRLLKTYQSPDKHYSLMGVVISHDEKSAIITNSRGKIRKMNLENGQTEMLLGRAERRNNPFYSAMVFDKGIIQYTAWQDGKEIHSERFRIPKDESRLNLIVQGTPRHLAIHPQKPLIAVSYGGGFVDLWNYETGRLEREIGAATNMIYTLAFSPDGKHLAMAGKDNTVKLWSPGATSYQTLAEGEASIRSLAFGPDGSWLAAGGFKRQLRLWETNTLAASTAPKTSVRSGKAPRTISGLQVGVSRSIEALAFHPQQELLAVGGHDAAITLWNPSLGQAVGQLSDPSLKEFSYALAFSPDGNYLASAHGDKTIRVWKLSDQSLYHTLKLHRVDAFSLVFHPKQPLLFAGCGDNTIKAWELGQGLLIKTLSGHEGTVNSLVFNQQGTRLYSGGGDGTIRIWNNTATSPLQTLQGQSLGLFAIALSPDESVLAAASNNVILWDLKQGKALATLWSFGKDHWLITQGSTFDASQTGRQSLHVVTGTTAHALETRPKVKHSPQLLKKIFKRRVFGKP
ncbi:MAG: WD40 repeat domain-containing protein [Proteobacteria bacterium]|nr:WD40 repeat domain-containing protein [Pseudomonadota bacterium]